MLIYNKTKCTQILDKPLCAFPEEIHPGVIIDDENYIGIDRRSFEPFDAKLLLGTKKFSLIRTYALGDILQLIPVFRYIKKNFDINEMYFITTDKYRREIEKIFPDINWVSEKKTYLQEYYGFVAMMDSILEKDHDPNNEESTMHRIRIYFRYFGIDPEIKPEDLDWGHKMSSLQPQLQKDKKFKYIGLQIKGSAAIKTLPYDYVKKLAFHLAETYKVVLIDTDKDSGFEGKNIVNLCGNTSIRNCISMMTELDCCITMDSGVLWMAHAANCPVLTILGPTREHERVSLHPQYPEKAKSINLSTDYVACSPCFESKQSCQGKINCMKLFDRDKLTQEISQKLKEIVGASE
jgi:ADP-heptose:LPS heptosyltransferase